MGTEIKDIVKEKYGQAALLVRGEVPAGARRSMELRVGCIAGAVGDYEYFGKLAKAGFDNIDIEATRVYSVEDARALLAGQGLDAEALAKEVDGKFGSAFARSVKPAPKCCAPSCCAGSAS